MKDLNRQEESLNGRILLKRVRSQEKMQAFGVGRENLSILGNGSENNNKIGVNVWINSLTIDKLISSFIFIIECIKENIYIFYWNC